MKWYSKTDKTGYLNYRAQIIHAKARVSALNVPQGSDLKELSSPTYGIIGK